MDRLISWRPDDHHHPTVQETNGLIAHFTVVPAPVRDRVRLAREDARCIEEIETALPQRDFPLRGIEGNLGGYYMYPQKIGSSSIRDMVGAPLFPAMVV